MLPGMRVTFSSFLFLAASLIGHFNSGRIRSRAFCQQLYLTGRALYIAIVCCIALLTEPR